MLYSRLSRRLRTLNLSSFRDYCDCFGGPDGAAEIGAMINAVTTNLTPLLPRIAPLRSSARCRAAGLLQRLGGNPASRKLRLWSAGCSSGEEPYSIAMTVKSTPIDFSRWDLRILATDLDTDMVAKERGRDAIAPPMPRASRPNWRPNTPTKWRRRPVRKSACATTLKQVIAFKQLNLMGDWPMRGPFEHAIFCRNVMIYFDHPTKARLIDRYTELLRPDGWLYIGHSEIIVQGERPLSAGGSHDI